MGEELSSEELARLAVWMDSEQLAGHGEVLHCRTIAGGSQNVIFELRRGPLRCALRKPPRQAPPGRDEGIVREWRLLAALDGSEVPHTPAVALCRDQAVLGAPFYLMGFVEGWSPASEPSWPEPFFTDPGARRGLGTEIVRGITELTKVDWRAKGLSDLGRPDGFHGRQVDRWMRFYERVRSRVIPGLDETTAWLRAHRPLDFEPGIMHGDYQFANVMYDHGAPARLAAIVDWEMGTIGDPKLDLAWVLQLWPDDPDAPADAGGGAYVDLSGMATKAELLDQFRHEAGRQVDDFDYYVVLARWKLAIVLEQGYRRSTQGHGDEKQALFGPYVLDLMRRAAALAGSSTYAAIT